jgi:hypothetical protein
MVISLQKLTNYDGMKTFKSFTCILVCMAGFFNLQAQDQFTVIKVNGNIVIQRTGTILNIGTDFSQNENLLFQSTDSRAAVINPVRGRYILTSETSSAFRESKSVFLPASGKVSTRAIGGIHNVNDLKNYLEGYFVIFDQIKIRISPDVFPMNEKMYFYIRYTYKNEVINKKLSFKADTLIILKNELLTIDGQQIPNPDITEMKLMYMEEGEKFVSTPICSFIPVFPDFELLKEEVSIIIDKMKGKPYKEIFLEISSYINDFYGKPDETNLRYWLRESFGLTP